MTDQMTPMERELLKSVDKLMKQTDESALQLRASAERIAMATHERVDTLTGCMSLLAECQLRLVNWCRASAEEASLDGSATKALAEVQQELQTKLKSLR